MEETTETTGQEAVETKEQETKEEHKRHQPIKAQRASLWAKIVGASIIIGGHFLKWSGNLPEATSTEICACGFAVMGIFGTVDLNILIDKFVSNK